MERTEEEVDSKRPVMSVYQGIHHSMENEAHIQSSSSIDSFGMSQSNLDLVSHSGISMLSLPGDTTPSSPGTAPQTPEISHTPQTPQTPSTPHNRTTFDLSGSASPSSSSSRQRKMYRSRISFGSSAVSTKRPLQSSKLSQEIMKPWLKYPDPKVKWAKTLFWAIFLLSFGAAGAMVFLNYRAIPMLGNICLKMDDDFSQGLRSDYWTREVQLDGYGAQAFDWTTSSSNNSFVKDNTLYLVPTLTSDSLGVDALTNGATVNLTRDGTCTTTNVTNCVAVSNSTTGSMVNVVQSARLTTRNKVGIKYGKVEVIARMPTGDWLWPAIWMLPTDSVYGAWPRSGEIDIAEARGNGPAYAYYGNNWITSALHWGPNTFFDRWAKTWGVRENKLKTYPSTFHSYTLEWSEKYISLYIDSRVFATYELNVGQTFWDLGNFPATFQNGTQQVTLDNPWISSKSKAAPYDQEFYLILNVAVGGNFFPDGIGAKPWFAGSVNPMKDFWAAKDQWYPTWPEDHTKRGMAIQRVRMWQQC